VAIARIQLAKRNDLSHAELPYIARSFPSCIAVFDWCEFYFVQKPLAGATRRINIYKASVGKGLAPLHS